MNNEHYTEDELRKQDFTQECIDWFNHDVKERRKFWDEVNLKLNKIPNTFEEAYDLFVNKGE